MVWNTYCVTHQLHKHHTRICTDSWLGKGGGVGGEGGRGEESLISGTLDLMFNQLNCIPTQPHHQILHAWNIPEQLVLTQLAWWLLQLQSDLSWWDKMHISLLDRHIPKPQTKSRKRAMVSEEKQQWKEQWPQKNLDRFKGTTYI